MAMYQKDRFFDDAYEVVERIGTGGFSKVYRCISKETSKEYAVKKICELEEDDKRNIEHEVYICQILEHRNILQLIEAFCSNKEHCLVFDIMPGGDLFDDIEKRSTYSEVDACHCFEQILSGVEYIHSQNIIHRDLKANNILLTDEHNAAIVKIADFGTAILNNDEEKESFKYIGTWLCAPPEMIHYQYIDTSFDMWSCGVLLCVLLIGSSPFYFDDPDAFDKITTANFTFPYVDNCDAVSEAGKDLICKLLTVDQKQRFTAEQALAHEFIRSRTTIASRFHRSKTIESLKGFNIEKNKAQSCEYPIGAGRMQLPPKSISDGTSVDHTFDPIKPAGYFNGFTEASTASSSQSTYSSIPEPSEVSSADTAVEPDEAISGSGEAFARQRFGCCSTQ